MPGNKFIYWSFNITHIDQQEPQIVLTFATREIEHKEKKEKIPYGK